MMDEPEVVGKRMDGGWGLGGSLPRRDGEVCVIRNIKVKEIRKRNTYRGQRGGERRE